jgi:F0F1-type ATP synthase membrane subunit b/b'
MSDHEDTDLSPEESISDEISERVRSVLAAAESAATAIRHEAEQQVQSKRRAAEAERQRYLEDAKAEAEALLEERMKRISELSDSLIEGAEAILMRIEGAQEVKRQLEAMVHALADAAEELAHESERGRATARPRPVVVDDEPEPRMRAVPDPKVVEPEPEAEPDVTEVERAGDEGPAVTSDLKPVEVVPEVDEGDEEVEVVDAVEVVDEPDPKPESPSAMQRLRKSASSRGDNGDAKEAEKPAAESRGFDGDDMLAARLVALQMAVAGSARVEVEAHLRKTFSLDEPGAILNDVFGTESKL